MPLLSTPAIVLSSLRYSETSKIVRLATREHGVQSAIAKGALRPRSRFGAALQVLSVGQAQLIHSDHRDLHTLTAFDVAAVPVGLTAHVGRYATAAALAEIMLRAAPAEPHPEAFDALEAALPALSETHLDALPALAIRVVWRLVSALGFGPGLSGCVRDARPLEAGGMAFSVPEGGALCRRCAQGAEVTELPADARAALERLVGDDSALPVLDPPNAAAHRRLLTRYITYHLAEGTAMPAIAFWQHGAWGTA